MTWIGGDVGCLRPGQWVAQIGSISWMLFLFVLNAWIINSFFIVVFRCKLFYKKDDKFQERGLGFLHLKSCGDNAEKTQLIIRTDTALGKYQFSSHNFVLDPYLADTP